MISLQSLLSTPEPSDPQDAVVAQHYMMDKASFETTARYWTQIYATTSTSRSEGVDEILIAGLEPSHVAQ
jgi:ubiquitin-conjugating enzyme (huntingtin interacting protein 2)